MADISEMFFLLSFFGLMGAVGLKLYNIMSVGTIYDFRMSIITLVFGALMFGLQLVTSILNYTSLVMIQLGRFAGMLLLLLVIFFIIELFMGLSTAAQNNTVHAKQSIKDRQD
jgi:hypothetical protein